MHTPQNYTSAVCTNSTTTKTIISFFLLSLPQIRQLTLSIASHEEDFLGMERCLQCIDRGMRSQVMDNLRRVRRGEVKGGTWVYQPVYPRVVDALNGMLGTYHEANKRDRTKTRKEKKTP